MSNISEIVVELFKEASIYLPSDVKFKLKQAEEIEYGACKDTLKAIELNNNISYNFV